MLHLSIFQKSFGKIQGSLISDKNNVKTHTHIFDHFFSE